MAALWYFNNRDKKIPLSVRLWPKQIIYYYKRLINFFMANTYPLPAYHFIVEWGGTAVGFTSVSGLDIQIEAIEYREGSSPETQSIKMPGRSTFSSIVLKRGIKKGDTDFFKWINTHSMNTIERRDIVIHLLDEAHQPVVTWKIKNAFPIRYSGPMLSARANEVAMEELELTHEGLTVIS
jgi:phage tail-like protein